ncbi:MAG TPA: hypothetical protein VF468_23150, partial [Actinomycetota bacterium]|nr:hypothetical protein [Actinomycetota bacterium]
MTDTPIEDLDAAGTLAAVEGWHAEQRDREARLFLAAAHYADLHATPRLGQDGRVLAGMERLVRMGGAGTPKVREFAAAELGAALGRSGYAGQQLIADALDVRHRLPELWAGVVAGTVPVWLARRVAARTRELTPEQAGLIDTQLVEYADGRLGWTGFETLLEAGIVAADPVAAAAREEAARAEQFAKVGRSNEHGQKTLYLRADAPVVIRIDATLDYLVQALRALGQDDTECEDRLRVRAALILANPPEAVRLLAAYAEHRARSDNKTEDAPPPAEDEPPADDVPPAEEEAAALVEDAAEDEPPAGQAAAAAGVLPAGFTTPFRPTQISATGERWRFDPARLLPTVTLYLHLHQEAVDRDLDGVARWEGQGPVT